MEGCWALVELEKEEEEEEEAFNEDWHPTPPPPRSVRPAVRPVLAAKGDKKWI